jgi:hypothetical protein
MDSQELFKLTEQITTDTGESAININQSFVATFFLINGVLSAFIIFILVFFLLGPSGSKSEIFNDTTFYETPCIKTTDGNGFKNKPGSSQVEPCDPSNNTPVPSVLSSILNGSPSYDLSGNKHYHLANWVIGIGIFSNLFLIFSPYLHFIPETINEIRIKRYNLDLKKNIEKIIKLIKGQNTKLDESQEIQALEKIQELETDNARAAVDSDPNVETSETTVPQEGGSSNLENMKHLFKYISEFAGKLGGNNCDKGDALRLFFGMIHIVMILVLGSFIKGDPLGVSSGLFTLFVAILIIFLCLGSNIPSGSLKIIYALIGIVSFITWIYSLIFGKGKTLLSPSSILSSSAFIIGLGCFSYFSASAGDFDNSKSKKDKCPLPQGLANDIGDLVEKATNQLGKIPDNLTKTVTGQPGDQQGGGGDKESIACLFYNFFSNLKDSLGLGILKIFIIIIGILFTPNYQSGNLKDVLQGLYKGPLSIFITFCTLFVLIFNIMPFISYLLTIGKGDFSKEDLTHGNGLYSKGSQISFLEWCNFDPNPDDDNKCKPPTKLKGQRVVTLWNPLLWKEYGIIGQQETPQIPIQTPIQISDQVSG